MNAGEWVGTMGVCMLLFAFALNLGGKISSSSSTYLVLNIAGAALAALSSYLIRFWPFVVLEGVWMLSSVFILIKNKKNA